MNVNRAFPHIAGMVPVNKLAGVSVSQTNADPGLLPTRTEIWGRIMELRTRREVLLEQLSRSPKMSVALADEYKTTGQQLERLYAECGRAKRRELKRGIGRIGRDESETEVEPMHGVTWYKAPSRIEEFFQLEYVAHGQECYEPDKNTFILMDSTSITMGWDSDGRLWTLGISGVAMVRREARSPE